MLKTHRCLCSLATFGLLLISISVAGADDEQPLTADQLKFFETKIRPVLVQECYSCHSSKTGNAKGGLRLDSEQLTHLGGSSGPAVVPGDLSESLLYNAISYQDFSMPPKAKLPQAVIDDFRTWIEMGAPDPRKTEIVKLNSTITAEDIDEAKHNFWAYQKPVSPVVPKVANTSWPRSDIDRFVLAELEQASLVPAVDATPEKILRRLCFDLIGLPPSLEQIEYFNRHYAADPQKTIEYVVDRLLDMPQFGERWGRHWLDVARYAESNGREVNMTFPHAWRYRDYVIDSFNHDKPYDRFLQEQLAGDLLSAKTDAEWTTNLVATGFLAIGPKSLSERNPVQFAADLADEQLDTVTRVVLGTSVACARCHDHKFDPIPQSDYYSLVGIFASTETYFGVPASPFGSLGGIQNRQPSNLIQLPVDDANPFDPSYSQEELDSMSREIIETRQSLAESRRSQRDGTTSQTAIQNLIRSQARMESLSSLIGSVDKNGRPLSFCMGVQDSSTPQDVRVLVRGEIESPANVAMRGVPQVLSNSPWTVAANSSGRLELARWISSADHPLTARVMVNRVWQHTLGSGIVRSTEDFGSTGQPPTHPQLLDHLAIQFTRSGWSTKSLIRSIVTSRVYRMASTFDAEKFEQDPDNKLLWRANPRRLDAEAIRDSMLFVSGKIDLDRPRASEVAKVGYTAVRDGNLFNIGQMMAMSGNPDSVRDTAQQGFRRPSMIDRMRRFAGAGMRGMYGAGAGASERVDMVEATYRSIYLPIVRDQLPRSLEVFDFAEPSMVIGTRESSNTPNQALYMMNNPFVLEASRNLATRVSEHAGLLDEQIDQAFLFTFGRRPKLTERDAVHQFAVEYGRDLPQREKNSATLVGICQSLLASAEFRYLD